MCVFSVNLAIGVAGFSNSTKAGVRMADCTPEILQAIGMDDLPIMIGIKHCVDAQNPFDDEGHIHGIPLITLEQVPEFLGKPAFIFDSEKRRDSVVVVLDLLDPLDQPLFVCIHCNGDQDGTEVHYITGLYGKRQEGILGTYQRAVRDNRLLFVDKGRLDILAIRINKPALCGDKNGIIKLSENAASAKANRDKYNRRYLPKERRCKNATISNS